MEDMAKKNPHKIRRRYRGGRRGNSQVKIVANNWEKVQALYESNFSTAFPSTLCHNFSLVFVTFIRPFPSILVRLLFHFRLSEHFICGGRILNAWPDSSFFFSMYFVLHLTYNAPHPSRPRSLLRQNEWLGSFNAILIT